MSATPVFAVAVIRMVWEAVVNPFTGTLAIVILTVLFFLGAYALLVYFTIRPDWRKLKSLPVVSGLALLATGGFTGSIIHFIRFVSSPQAAAPLSVVLASLFIFASASGYTLILWIAWSTWKERKNRE